MKTPLLLSLLAGVLVTGCSTRGLYDAGGAAAGGAAAYYASDGDPLITAAGAAGGALITDSVQGMISNSKRSEYNRGYDRGRSDAVKQQYWVMQRSKKDLAQEARELRYRYYEIPAPTETNTKGGVVKTVPHNVVVPVVSE